MKKQMQLICISIVALVLFGCANTNDNIKIETARSIGGNISPEDVTLTEIDRGMTTVKWKAAAPSGNFACSADDMLRRVLCVKKEPAK